MLQHSHKRTIRIACFVDIFVQIPKRAFQQGVGRHMARGFWLENAIFGAKIFSRGSAPHPAGAGRPRPRENQFTGSRPTPDSGSSRT